MPYRIAGPLGLASVLIGCSQPSEPSQPAAPAATVRLATGNADANAPAIAALFRQTCLEAGSDPGTLAAALQNSGWEHEQVQTASAALPIAAWRLDHGELVHSAFSPGPGANFIDCQLAIDAEVAPSLTRMRDALRPLVRHPSLRRISDDAPQVKWQWQAGPREQLDLTISPPAARRSGSRPGGRPRLAIHFGRSVGPPQPEPQPIPDEIANAIENVQ